jgi:PncC family amidohydrolase
MAKGVRATAGSDMSVSITGVAGPDGGSPAKPVGTTFVALVGASFERVEHKVWDGDRDSNRRESALLALQMINEYLEGITGTK